jgi:hypothetical protein
MIHYVADLLWTPFVTILKFGTAAYVLGKGLLATLYDLVDFSIKLLED